MLENKGKKVAENATRTTLKIPEELDIAIEEELLRRCRVIIFPLFSRA